MIFEDEVVDLNALDPLAVKRPPKPDNSKLKTDDVNELLDIFDLKMAFDGEDIQLVNKWNNEPLEMKFGLSNGKVFSIDMILENKYNNRILLITPQYELWLRIGSFNGQITVKSIVYEAKKEKDYGLVDCIKVEMPHGSSIPGIDIKYSERTDTSRYYEVNIKDYDDVEISIASLNDYNQIVNNKDLSNEECMNILNGLPCLDALVNYFAKSYPHVKELLDAKRQEKSAGK